VTGPSWLAGTLAVVMIATAIYCFGRLVAARHWRRATDYDVDGVHMLMGVAMAGMLVPRLNPLSGSAWELIFGAAVAWFGWHAIGGYRSRPAAGRRWVAHDLQHLVACGAMLYMFLAVSVVKAGSTGTGMSMNAPAASTRPPTLALVFALALLGYVIWTADRLTSVAPVAALRAMATQAGAAAAPALAAPPASAAAAGPAADGTAARAAAGPTADGTAARPAQAGRAGSGAEARQSPQTRTPMSPRLAACCEIAMGLTMGYMLITML
jgi:hypothetical protein